MSHHREIAAHLVINGRRVIDAGGENECGHRFTRALALAYRDRYVAGELYGTVVQAVVACTDPQRRVRWQMIAASIELLLKHDAGLEFPPGSIPACLV